LTLHKALAVFFARSLSRVVRYGFVNGLPGFVTKEHGEALQTTVFAIENGKIAAIYIMRNPDKLRHLAGESLH